jgi:hypothetical protein
VTRTSVSLSLFHDFQVCRSSSPANQKRTDDLSVNSRGVSITLPFSECSVLPCRSLASRTDPRTGLLSREDTVAYGKKALPRHVCRQACRNVYVRDRKPPQSAPNKAWHLALGATADGGLYMCRYTYLPEPSGTSAVTVTLKRTPRSDFGHESLGPDLGKVDFRFPALVAKQLLSEVEIGTESSIFSSSIF